MKHFFFIFLIISQISNAQDLYKYFKSPKNIIKVESCKNISNKNENIKCLDTVFTNDFDAYFSNKNSINYDSIKSNRNTYFEARFEMIYNENGNLDLQFKEYNGFNQNLINSFKSKTDVYLVGFKNHVLKNYENVIPAIDFDNKDIQSKIPLTIGIKTLNNDVYFGYKNIHYKYLDLNNYKNEDETKKFYSYVYKKIENTFNADFAPLAKKNNIDKAYAHVYFTLDEKGKVIKIENVQEGNKVFEKYLIEQFNKIRKDIESNSVPAKLIDNTAVERSYLMSFKYGYN